MAMSMDAKSMKDLRENVSCSICLSVFTKPKVLPCFHTFCEKCISDHITKTVEEGMFLCPMCNDRTAVPEGGPGELRNNVFLSNIIEIIFPVSEAPCVVCGIGGKEEPAEAMCIQCGDHLCQSCVAAHKKTRVTMDHHLVSLTDLEKGEYFSEIRAHQKIFCLIHPKKALEIFCETCKIPICLLCKVFDEHDQHQVTKLEKASRRANDELKDLVAISSSKAELVVALVGEVEKSISSTEIKRKELTETITKYFADVRGAIDEKEQQMLEQLSEFSNLAKKHLDTRLHETKCQSLLVSKTVESVETLLEKGSDIEKLLQYQYLVSRLKKINDDEMSKSIGEQHIHHNLPPFANFMNDMNLNTFGKPLQRAININSFCVKKALGMDKLSECLDLHFNHGKYFTFDIGNTTVQVFDRSGNFQGLLDHGEFKLQAPRGVSSNEDGDVFVTDNQIHGVIVYNKYLKQKKVTKDVYSGESARIACETNRMLVVDGTQLVIINTRGVGEEVVDARCLGLSTFKPLYVTVCPSGDVIVTDNNSKCVHILDSTCSSILFTYSPVDGLALSDPYGACCDQWGHVIIADCDAESWDKPGCLHVISTTGDHLGIPVTRADGLMDPTGVVISGPGEVSVIEYSGTVKVYKYLDV